MPFKFAVGNVIEVPVKGSLNNGDADLVFDFTVRADRLSADQFDSEVARKGATVTDFLVRHVKGWSKQKLVLDEETGQPAPFSEEALLAMCSITGMGSFMFRAYSAACVPADTEAGRRGN
jgi:hypothetical protein